MLRVLSQNIWNVSGGWRDRLTELVAWIDRLAPDVVCLQEVCDDGAGRNQGAELAERLAGDWYAAYAGTEVGFAPGNLFGNAILSRRPIEVWNHDALPYEPREDDIQRLLLHARTGGIDVFCTHLNWRYDDGCVRERQVEAIVAVMAERADPDSPLPQILAGDFNAEPDSNEIRYLTGLGTIGGRSTYFQDAWRVAGGGPWGGDPGFTWDNRNPFAAAEHEPDRRIDYVFCGWRRPDGAGRIESARVVTNRSLTGVCASDHYGLLAEIVEPRQT